MVYPKIFKEVALSVPVLKGIVKERDRLRGDLELAVSQNHKSQFENAKLHCQSDVDHIGVDTPHKALQETQLQLMTNQNEGYCHCCRSKSIFQINHVWLRDNYICVNCFSIPRQRHVQYILDSYFKGWDKKEIHESSPSNRLISQYCKAYSSSQYFNDIDAGKFHEGVRCENLESMTFADNSFDVFISQDVFEHIFNPDLAAKEIMRVLKPGGIHVFTTPKYSGLDRSYRRAQLTDTGIEYLYEAEYHGNPIGDGKSLVTFHFGDDFENLVFKWAGVNTTTYVTRCRDIGIDGEFIEVFVSKKPD